VGNDGFDKSKNFFFLNDNHFVEAHVAGGEACERWWPLELCWRERKLLAGPPKPDQRVGARLSVVHWSSRLAVGHGANSTPYKVSCYETTRKW